MSDLIPQETESKQYYKEDLLYKMFGINAELLIDHAWGYEPCTMEEVKQYRPENSSTGTGQVLQHPYTAEKAKLIVKEMTDLLVLDLVKKKNTTDQLTLTIGYDRESLTDEKVRKEYTGTVKSDYYGRPVPKHAHGTTNLKRHTSSTKVIMDAVLQLFDEIVDPRLLVRRVNITANRLPDEKEAAQQECFEQMDLFSMGLLAETKQEDQNPEKEKKMQEAILQIQRRYGKNALLKGRNLEEGAMTRERNRQIGGHKA